jgi:hypothetical protein
MNENRQLKLLRYEEDCCHSDKITAVSAKISANQASLLTAAGTVAGSDQDELVIAKQQANHNDTTQ